jgi:hypothetical protein
MQHLETQESDGLKASQRMPEARYSYYRRCQVFRRNGEQCKAPAEKGEQICHAHAAQLAMAARRERERQAVLEEAVAEMRKRGKPEYEIADLFTDFKGIQVAVAVVAKALITGRIDCKTSGQMLVHLQTMSKLLWACHRVRRGTQKEKTFTTKDTKKPEVLRQICADERRLGKGEELSEFCVLPKPKNVPCVYETAGSRVSKLGVITLIERSLAHGPPELIAA